tara:strand:+ start:1552 stop:2484 length:933 start_codon:yes stop_codon:yes gene_type:complete
MKNLFFLKICFLGILISTAQEKKISLYPEGVACENNLKEEVEYDSSGRIFKKVVNPEIWYYPSSKAPKNKKKAAVLVIPGGGYWGLWFDKEGVDVAKWLNTLGVSAFVLKHRVPHWESNDCRSKVALLDAQRAIRIIRANSGKWEISQNKIGVLGFSAGGHLASSLSTHHDNGLDLSNIEIDKTSSRPDYSILVYPVITMKPPYAHMGSRKNLLGEIPNEEHVNYFSNELQVRDDTPPAILFHTDQDKAVPAENSIKYYLSLRKYNIPAELHIWQSGAHGLGLAKDDGLPFKDWPKTCEQWMIDRKIIDQ